MLTAYDHGCEKYYGAPKRVRTELSREDISKMKEKIAKASSRIEGTK